MGGAGWGIFDGICIGLGMFVPPMLKHPILVGGLAVITPRMLALNCLGCFPIVFELNNCEFIPNSAFSLHLCEKRGLWRCVSENFGWGVTYGL